MAKLIADAKLREDLGQRAAERSRSFTEAAVMPELARLYEETASVRCGNSGAEREDVGYET